MPVYACVFNSNEISIGKSKLIRCTTIPSRAQVDGGAGGLSARLLVPV